MSSYQQNPVIAVLIVYATDCIEPFKVNLCENKCNVSTEVALCVSVRVPESCLNIG